MAILFVESSDQQGVFSAVKRFYGTRPTASSVEAIIKGMRDDGLGLRDSIRWLGDICRCFPDSCSAIEINVSPALGEWIEILVDQCTYDLPLAVRLSGELQCRVLSCLCGMDKWEVVMASKGEIYEIDGHGQDGRAEEHMESYLNSKRIDLRLAVKPWIEREEVGFDPTGWAKLVLPGESDLLKRC